MYVWWGTTLPTHISSGSVRSSQTFTIQQYAIPHSNWSNKSRLHPQIILQFWRRISNLRRRPRNMWCGKETRQSVLSMFWLSCNSLHFPQSKNAWFNHIAVKTREQHGLGAYYRSPNSIVKQTCLPQWLTAWAHGKRRQTWWIVLSNTPIIAR